MNHPTRSNRTPAAPKLHRRGERSFVRGRASTASVFLTALAGTFGCMGAPHAASPADLIEAHRVYASEVLEEIRSCMADPGDAPQGPNPGGADPAPLAPGIRSVCSCYRGLEFEEPLLHRLRLVVNAQGIVRRVEDSGSGDGSRFGVCEPQAVEGLRMPAPPGPAVLEIRLTDVLVRRRSHPTETSPSNP
jgi:hypothetical protein